jgi:filamentous hemagglutinin
LAKLYGSRTIDPKKITEYLLNDGHPDGAGKAKFFVTFGYSKLTADALMRAIDHHAGTQDVISTEATKYGVKSVIKCALITPDARNPCIVAVWIKETGTSEQRFVTAYPN